MPSIWQGFGFPKAPRTRFGVRKDQLGMANPPFKGAPQPVPERWMNGRFGCGSDALAYTSAHRTGRSVTSHPETPPS